VQRVGVNNGKRCYIISSPHRVTAEREWTSAMAPA
jgi:hypothetical protein